MKPAPLTPVAVAQLAQDAGFTGWQVAVMGAICTAESGRRELAVNVVWNPGNVAHLSIDAGLWQLNSYWCPRVVGPMFGEYNAAVLTPELNADMAHRMWRAAFDQANGTYSAKLVAAYRTWTTYRNGLPGAILTEATAAARTIGAIP